MKWLLLLLVALSTAVNARVDEGVPPPPAHAPQNTLRVSCHAAMAEVAHAWLRGFAAAHPQVRVQLQIVGSDAAMAQLYTAQTDIALIGRSASDSELKAFEWVFRYPPTAYEVMNGSLDQAGRAPAMAILVHRSNPLRQISLAQLDHVFARRNDGSDLSHWSQLGVDPSHRLGAITLYGPKMESGSGRYFRQRVVQSSNRMQWTRFTEFDEPVLPAGRLDTAAQRAAAALAADRSGMAIGVLPARDAEVVALELVGDDGRAVALNRQSIINRRYPLSRTIAAYVNQPPDAPLNRDIARFLDFVLSAPAQDVIELEHGYLPLAAAHLQEQRARLIQAGASTTPPTGTSP